MKNTKKITLTIASLALFALVSSPAFAQTTTTMKPKVLIVKENETKTVDTQETKNLKKANLNYAAAIKSANTEYNMAVKNAKKTYADSLKTAKTKTERVAALKTEKDAINAAKKVRTEAHMAALNALKVAKNTAK